MAPRDLSDEQWLLLLEMRESQDHGAFSVACDGKRRDPANQLAAKGYADWRGTSWGSSFYAITNTGREYIDAH